jgi:hypothetical protein
MLVSHEDFPFQGTRRETSYQVLPDCASRKSEG